MLGSRIEIKSSFRSLGNENRNQKPKVDWIEIKTFVDFGSPSRLTSQIPWF